MTANTVLTRSATSRLTPLPLLRRALSVGSALSDRGCCLTFHRAAPSAVWQERPNRGFYLDLDFLERLIVHLQRSGWAIVTMDDAVRRSGQPGGGRFVNFSIDDCYRDTAELVVPLFRRLGAPVTLFVTTGIPDGTMPLRDAGLETILTRHDAVAEGGRTYPLRTRAQRRAAYATISAWWGRSNGDAAYLRFCERHGEDADGLRQEHAISWDMLAALRDEPVVEFGAHTISHPRIAALPPDRALAELRGGRERLEEMLGRPVRHFAFPFGRRKDCTERDFALARDAGFESAATTSKGLLRPGADPFRLPRNTLNGEHRSLAVGSAHLLGLSGLLARMMGRV